MGKEERGEVVQGWEGGENVLMTALSVRARARIAASGGLVQGIAGKKKVNQLMQQWQAQVTSNRSKLQRACQSITSDASRSHLCLCAR